MTSLHFPKSFETLLLKHLKTHYLKGANQTETWNQKDTIYFAKGVKALNQIFTTERQNTKQNYFFDPVMRSGYLAYFLPVNVMKAFSIFTKLNPSIVKEKISILDIGSGPLTLTLSYLFFLEKKLKKKKGKWLIEITALEQNEKILKDGISLLQNWVEVSELKNKVTLKIKPIVRNALSFKMNRKKFDIFLVGNFLNEITSRAKQQKSILDYLNQFSHQNSQIFFLEPSTKKVARDLQALRDCLLEKSSFRVLGPCLHQEICPLNVTAKADWCHFLEPWSSPKFIQQFDKKVGLKKTNLMYSYLFMQNHFTPKEEAEKFIAISNAMKLKGRLELIGCGQAGRVKFIRSNINESKQNDIFKGIHRGQYFSYPDLQTAKFQVDRIVNIGKNNKILFV